MSGDYVRSVVTAYLALPHTPDRATPYDRRLALALHSRAIPLATVRAAFALAIARRTSRPVSAEPLAPIRSLAYFLPVLEEVLRSPLDAGYLAYLYRRLDASTPHPSA